MARRRRRTRRNPSLTGDALTVGVVGLAAVLGVRYLKNKAATGTQDTTTFIPGGGVVTYGTDTGLTIAPGPGGHGQVYQ